MHITGKLIQQIIVHASSCAESPFGEHSQGSQISLDVTNFETFIYRLVCSCDSSSLLFTLRLIQIK